MRQDPVARLTDRIATIEGWPVPRDPEPLVWEDEAEEAPSAAVPPAGGDAPPRDRPA